MPLPRFIAVLVGLLLLVGRIGIAPSSVRAQEDDLPVKRPGFEKPKRVIVPEFRVLGEPTFCRTGSVIPVVWTLNWNSEDVLEGRLIFSIVVGLEEAGTFTSEDLALARGKQSYRFLLPALPTSDSASDTVEVRARFIPNDLKKDKVFEFGDEFALRLPARSKRQFVYAILDASDLSLSETVRSLEERAAISKTSDGDPADSYASFTGVKLGAPDFPNDPLYLCGFDVLFVTGQGLSDLREPQLKALQQWVEAGGSVCLWSSGRLLARHLVTLNSLVRELKADPFELDGEGALTGGPGGEEHILSRCGLGRVVVLREGERPAAFQASREAWREVEAFLWRIAPQARRQFVEQGTWAKVAQRPVVMHDPNNPWRQQALPAPPSPLSVRYLQSGYAMVRGLIPETVQLVPLTLLGGILGAYLLIVGPGEYFGLGALRLRKATWVTFPLATLLCAGGTVWISNQYMYSKNESRSIDVLDVIDQGKIVRLNRLRLLFTNTTRRITENPQRSVLTPLDRRAFGVMQNFTSSATESTEPDNTRYYNYQQNVPFEPQYAKTASMVSLAEYSGRMPGNYTIEMTVPQWSPQLIREFILAPEVAPVAFAWDAYDEEDFTSVRKREQLTKDLRKVFGESVIALLVHGGEVTNLTDGADYFPAETPGAQQELRSLDGRGLILDLSMRPSRTPATSDKDGVFQRFSQIAPTGGDSFEDMVLYEPAETDQWLLLVWVRDGVNFKLYRKLYRPAQPGPAPPIPPVSDAADAEAARTGGMGGRNLPALPVPAPGIPPLPN